MAQTSARLGRLSLLLTSFLAVAIGLLPVTPALADNQKSVCIRSIDINRTAIPDDRTILFYMIGGKVWKNTLIGRCVGLRLATNGFTYSPIPGTNELCSNLQTIRVNDNGNVCLLGEFTPFDPKAAAKP